MQRLHVTAILKCFQGRSLGKVRTNGTNISNMAQKEYKKHDKTPPFSRNVYMHRILYVPVKRGFLRGVRSTISKWKRPLIFIDVLTL